ncbi:MAG: peptidoglycan DD-metalloendopeptidase family protein [Steroidobacteraceae bacterium]
MKGRKFLVAGLALASITSFAQTGYKYRDANGQWVYTDRAPSSAAQADTFNLVHENTELHIAVDREDGPESTQLIAVNDCICTVTFTVTVAQSGDPAIPGGANYRATLDAGTRRTLVQVQRSGSGDAGLKYRWYAALGSPDAVHNPTSPYRVPFSIGSTYTISQAYPSRITHVTPDSQFAVDIALPDGTPIYAAREGTVIIARHDFFRDALAPVMMDQANVIEILHGDGTIAMYAHLHWDSIRVHIGDRVVRGQYIADSGNTGFTSGPHLHFAVLRNAGGVSVSVPILFAGGGGIAITPATGMALTAY